MKRIALLVTVLALGCDNKRPEERKLPGSAAPTTTGAPAPSPAGPVESGSAGAGAAAPAVKTTGFAPFDDALAGKVPWIAADDKAGIVELHAVADPSGKTAGKLAVERRCGADAAKAVEALGAQIAERARASDRPPPQCKEDGGITSCVQPGSAEGDVTLELEYARAGDAWRVIGAKTYGAGIKMDKEEARYAALLKEPCK